MRYQAIALDYGGTLAHGEEDPVLRQRPVAADAVVALRALHALGMRLVLVSNTLPHHDRRLALHAADVADLFLVTFQSASLGVGKPDPLIPRLVIAATNCPPARILSVGNNLDNDVRAAMTAGLAAALVRPRGLIAGEVLPQGAHLIGDVTALPGLVKEDT